MMGGNEPILDADGRRIVDSHGRCSRVTSAGYGPSVDGTSFARFLGGGLGDVRSWAAGSLELSSELVVRLAGTVREAGLGLGDLGPVLVELLRGEEPGGLVVVVEDALLGECDVAEGVVALQPEPLQRAVTIIELVE